MFERMEISETVYEGIAEPSSKKSTIEYANYAGHNRKMRAVSDLSKNTLIWVVAMESVSKGMHIVQESDRN